MWQKQLLTQETENAAPGGMTYRVCSEKWSIEAVGECDWSSNRLQVSMQSGEYVYQSGWLDMSPLLPHEVMARLFPEVLERFLVLATLPYTQQQSSWQPLELTILLYKTIEPLLA